MRSRQVNDQDSGMRNSLQLIEAHITHMRAEGYAADTVTTAATVTRKANRELDHGLACAIDEEIAGWLANPAWTTKTRNIYHTHITRFLRWATRGGYIDFDPSAGIRSPRVRAGLPHPATDEQVRACVCCDPPWQLMFLLAAYAGMRSGEIARLRREHVTAEAINIRGKGDKERVVPTHPHVWALVEPAPAGPLLRLAGGGPFTPKELSTRAGKYLRLQLGLPIRPHSLRHWFATRQVDAGVNLRTTQELLGHSSPAMTAVYTRVSTKLMVAAVTGLPDLTG